MVRGRLDVFLSIFIRRRTQSLRNFVNFPSNLIELGFRIRLDSLELFSDLPQQYVLAGCYQDRARSDVIVIYLHLRHQQTDGVKPFTRCALPRGDKSINIIQLSTEAFLSRLDTCNCLLHSTQLGMQPSVDGIQSVLELLSVLTFDSTQS